MADIIVLLVVAVFAIIGARRGLIKTLVGAASTLISLILSMLLYKPVSEMLYNSTFGDAVKVQVEVWMTEQMGNAALLLQQQAVETAAMLLINVISFIVVILVVKIAVILIAKIANLTAKLPIIKQANSLLGMVAGAAGGLLVCYIVIGIIAALGSDVSFSAAIESVQKSILAIKLYEGNIITKFLSDFIK